MKRSLKLLAVLVAISLCRQTSAAIFNPNDVASLIAAINTSNTNNEDDTIELATNGTYTLTAPDNGSNGLPVILSDGGHKLVIHGNGATLQRSTAGGTPAFRIFQIGTGAHVTISGLTITNGSVTGDLGGGILNDHATLTVTNSTLSRNSALDDDGGGIFNAGGNSGSATLIVTNSTLSGNSALNGGGGIFNDGTLTIGNTILNAGATGANIANCCGGTITSLGYNLSSDDASAFLNQTGDQNSTNPLLGPLQDNGGPTFTHLPSRGSPAIDMGDPALGMDQRGPVFVRVVNGRIDIGAVEVQTTPIQSHHH